MLIPMYRVLRSRLTLSEATPLRGIPVLLRGQPQPPVLGTSSVSFTIAPATEWTRVDLRVTGGKLYLDSGQYLSSNKLFDVAQRKEFTTLSMFTNSSGVVTAQLIQNSGQVAKITATIPGSDEPGKTYTGYLFRQCHNGGAGIGESSVWIYQPRGKPRFLEAVAKCPCCSCGRWTPN